MHGADLRSAALAFTGCVGPATGQDWSAPVPDLDWTVAETVRHLAGALLWYPIDAAAGPDELPGVDVVVKPDATPAELANAVERLAAVLGAVVDGLPPTTRGFHPFGAADPAGFAAMGCDEILIHTDDAARGLGLDFEPPAELCERVLGRLFPWAPAGVGTPWERLRWANGRIALPGHPRLTRWRWQAAPLDEWDGTRPGIS